MATKSGLNSITRGQPAQRFMLSIRAASEFLWAGVAVAVVTVIGLLIEPLTGYPSIALLYLLLVVILGLKLSRGPVLLTATASAILWNFLFIPPQWTFYVDKVHDAMLFGMFFVVALAMGHLTSRVRVSEQAERRRERRTAALYDLVHEAALAPDLDTGLRAAVKLIDSLFEAQAALLLRLPDHTLSPRAHPASSFFPSKVEIGVASWAFARGTPAGRFTDTLTDAEALHVPLQARTAVMGVLSLRPSGKSFDVAERELLEAFASLIGTILEKDHFIQAFKRAEIIEASERLHRALFDSVSHELKTPLSAVQTGLDALAKQLGDDDKKRTLREVRSAVRRLRRVINNLLEMTRIEAGVIKPKLEWCDAGELIRAASELAQDVLHDRQIIIDLDGALPMVKLDQPLLEQCVSNLLINAAGSSKPGTKITIRARLHGDKLLLSVLDEGRGLTESDLAHAFDKFYRASEAGPGGTGLGLSIVEGLVRAHGGSVRAQNRPTGGAEFTLTIPVQTMPVDAVRELA
jgi:two-component system sensor histidine kinase KdpD